VVGKKRIVFCFDGSWNALDSGRPTNVVIVAQSVQPYVGGNMAQVIHYDDGVGTGGGDWKWMRAFDRWTGGIFGWGALDNIREAYRFLIFNYEVGDEIFVFGFSRGAYTARSFIGLLRCASIPRRRHAGQIGKAIEFYRNRKRGGQEHETALFRFRADHSDDLVIDDKEEDWRRANVPNYAGAKPGRLKVRFVGVWDTVGALGLPAGLPGSARFNGRHQFHDPELPDFVEFGRHAVAIDERRRTFAPTLWTNADARNVAMGADPADPLAPVQERWFPGTHGSVGGGGDVLGLSDGALVWVMEGARQAGLELDVTGLSRVYAIKPNFRDPVVNVRAGPDRASKLLLKKDRNGPTVAHQVHLSAVCRWAEPADALAEGKEYRPPALQQIDMAALAAQLPPRYTGPLQAHHVVAQGETLSEIAKLHYGSADFAAILQANYCLLGGDPNQVYVGQTLVIPLRPARESGAGPAPTP
jgi:uncharacterized protein (DUF2235 family)